MVRTHKGCRCSGTPVALPGHMVEHLLVRGRSVSASLWWTSRHSSLGYCSLWYLFTLSRRFIYVSKSQSRARMCWRGMSFSRAVIGTSLNLLHPFTDHAASLLLHRYFASLFNVLFKIFIHLYAHHVNIAFDFDTMRPGMSF